MTTPSVDFTEPGQADNIDHRLHNDSSGPPNNWRWDTPPAGEDGTVPDRRLTVTGGTGLTGPGVILPLNPSTFDIPDSEMG